MITTIKNIIKYILGFFYWNASNIKNKTMIHNYKTPIGSKIGKFVMIRKETFIYGKINIGDYSYISGPNTLVHEATIGKFCSIARNCIIGPGNHKLSSVSTHPFLYSLSYGFIEKAIKPSKNTPPIIGNDVWIGINSIVMNNVKIGDGAIIGAGAIVTNDVEPYSIVGGVPAKHLKYRFSKETIDALKEIKWWNWPYVTIKERITDFDNIDDFVSKYYNNNSNTK